ncbi:hypothetical protein F2Q68_00035412 [Brassica cretica]|uniref:Uncharacterized protein n=1 Tax=Brassica cretica TaxID=69181 RepID=A0A8S9H158_BRACR|nr:hypothetical protein F2Q68_00035412 [Brassica cretica]
MVGLMTKYQMEEFMQTLERERLTADVAPLGVLMLPLEVLTSRGWCRCKGDVVCDPASATFHLHCILFLCSCDFEAFEDDFVASSPYVPENPRDCVVSQADFRPALRKDIGRTDEVLFLYLHSEDMIWVLEISDDFVAFWRYLEQAPEMTIEIDNRCMSSSTRSNKEQTLLFSDPARLERSIHKEKRTASIDNNISLSTDTRLPP